MRDRILGLLDKADLAAAASAAVVDQAELIGFASTVKHARERLESPDDVVVVALMGGTGSGKSSLFNAIAGEDLADVGGVRPTTDQPSVAISAERAFSFDRYLDGLGITSRHVAGLPKWLCLIDMPDTDSVELDHRFQAESLLGRLDVIVWVVDPEKYRDAALHHRYLRPLASLAGQFVFVLNQVDRLSSDERAIVADDLVAALAEDGIDGPEFVLTAANPAVGPPVGVEDLLTRLETFAADRSGSHNKLLLDLAEATNRLIAEAGGSGIGFEERVGPFIEETTKLIDADDLDGAVDFASGVIEEVAREMSRPVAKALMAFAVRLPEIVATAAVSDDTERVLRDELVDPSRQVFSARAEANAALVELALDIASMRASVGV